MTSLKNFIIEELVNEARQIQLTGDTKFNQFIVMAGGAASGKGFAQSFINADFKVLDVDALKEQYAKRYPNPDSPDKKLNFKDPSDVSKLHELVKKTGWKETQRRMIGASVRANRSDRLPNILLDITAKDTEDFIVANALAPAPYRKTLVWVVQSLDVAQLQNSERSRSVPREILKKTHEGSYKTVLQWLEKPEGPTFDDVWIYLAKNPKQREYSDSELKNRVYKLEKNGDKFIIPDDLKKEIDEFRNSSVDMDRWDRENRKGAIERSRRRERRDSHKKATGFYN